MGDLDGYGEGSSPGARARDRVRILVSFMGRIGERLDIWSGFDVRVRQRFNFRFTVRCGRC